MIYFHDMTNGFFVRFVFVFTLRDLEVRFRAGRRYKGPLHDLSAVDQALEFHAPLTDKTLQTIDITDTDDP